MSSRSRSTPEKALEACGPVTDSQDQLERFRTSLLRWFDTHARQLPWRTDPRDPYLVWVSEIMLQQTRVEAVREYFTRFINKYPTLQALAQAPLDDVLAAWSGLGYYRRARALHQAVGKIVNEHEGKFPDELESLPGVGPYTAAAIGSLAFGRRVAVVDGNVQRVLSRLGACGLEVGTSRAARWAREQAEDLLDPEQPGRFNEAMMELGALVCTPTSPSCQGCPVEPWCRARRLGLVEQFPRMARKKAPTLVQRTALVVLWGKRTLLARRKRTGLYGGMWEPIALPGGLEKAPEFLSRAGVHTPCREVGLIKHQLSHRSLVVHVCRLHWRPTRQWPAELITNEYDEVRWFDAAAIDSVGISTLARKILSAAEVGSPKKTR